MNNIYKIMTLNINRIAHPARLDLLGNLLRRQEIDIALLQEVTTDRINSFPNHTAYVNIGTDLSGTAILTRAGILLTDVKRLPNGRGMAGLFQKTWIVNIYAPLGTEKREEREHFYATEIVSLLPLTRSTLILAGDFNCILRQSDATGRKNFSRTLDELVRGLRLHDVYENTRTNLPFTHYTLSGATRIDRMYVSADIQPRQTGVDTRAAVFTDHFAVTLRLNLAIPVPARGNSYWKINISLLESKDFRNILRSKWTHWCSHKNIIRHRGCIGRDTSNAC
jgi:exonuclease III